MAPKRGRRRVVKTTKVVEETTRTLEVVSTMGFQSHQSESQDEQEAQAHETKRSESRSYDDEPDIPKEEAQAQAHKKKKKKKKRGVGGGEGYKVYVYRVMKQVHPGMGITGGAMSVINNFIEDMFERLAREAYNLSLHSKKPTMSVREIQAAVKLVLPGELAKHALAEGTKAVTNYFSFSS